MTLFYQKFIVLLLHFLFIHLLLILFLMFEIHYNVNSNYSMSEQLFQFALRFIFCERNIKTKFSSLQKRSWILKPFAQLQLTFSRNLINSKVRTI